MEYPHGKITGQSANPDSSAFVYLFVQQDSFAVDTVALAAHIQQWLLDNVPEVISTTAEYREQVYPVTQLPPLPV